MCFIGVYFITAGRAQSDDSETRDILNALRRDGLLKYIPGRIRSTKNKYQSIAVPCMRSGFSDIVLFQRLYH